jgi:FkbM family methyltransferase
MNATLQEQLDKLFIKISSSPEHHSCLAPQYQELKAEARDLLKKHYSEKSLQSAHLPNIGEVQLPFFSMGNVNSVNLFDLDELILFTFYRIGKESYKKSLDIGANIGLHSIIMAKLGLNVTAFEPDPIHYHKLSSNIALNKVGMLINAVKSAVSKTSGKAEFTRVLGNTTGSHLSSAKDGAYGELEKFEVNVVGINSFASKADFIKLDAEGEELNIIQGIELETWNHLDIMAEVGNEHNAVNVLNYLEQIDVKVYSQKRAWQRVNSPSDMPTSYKEGSVFISRHNVTPWTSR